MEVFTFAFCMRKCYKFELKFNIVRATEEPVPFLHMMTNILLHLCGTNYLGCWQKTRAIAVYLEQAQDVPISELCLGLIDHPLRRRYFDKDSHSSSNNNWSEQIL